LTAVVAGKRWSRQGSSFPILALIALALPMLQIDKVSRYFLIAFPFLLLSRKTFTSKFYYAIIAIFSLTTTISMYGLFVIHPVRWPLAIAPENFAPSANALNSFILYIFTNDFFITLASTVNIVAFLLVATQVIDFKMFKTELHQFRRVPTWIGNRIRNSRH
jgi:hypothetical protein